MTDPNSPAACLQLDRLLYISQQDAQPAITGTLCQDGVYLLPGQEVAPSDALTAATTLAAELAGPLNMAGRAEQSDTDTPFLPFVLPEPLTPEALEGDVPGWLGLLPPPTDQPNALQISVQPSAFRLLEQLNERGGAGQTDTFYSPADLGAIRAVSETFARLSDARTVSVRVGGVAVLVLDLGRTATGLWAGLASLRIET